MSTAWAVKAHGTPAPKGSMKCVGGKGRHQLINNSPAAKAWQDVVAWAGRLHEGPALVGPLGVQITVTVERPKSTTVESRPWPHLRTAGDVDKHARTILDGLEQGGVLTDDAQVCEVHARKVYPDTPGVPDALGRPGALIRIYPLEGSAG